VVFEEFSCVVTDENACKPAQRMVTRGLVGSGVAMHEYGRGVFDGEFDDPCDWQRVLDGVITEIRGGIDA
jgi:hypothetical protein